MSAGKSVNEFGILDGSGRDLQSGVKGREARREKFMQDYASGGKLDVQQTSHHVPFPGASNVSESPSRYHNPSQTQVQMYSTVAPQADGVYAHSQSSEKKRYFSWRPGGDADKGSYRPVLNGVNESNEEQTRRKSWFGARSGGWKEAERARDRERLAQGGGEWVN